MIANAEGVIGKRLTKTFGSAVALDGVDFILRPRQITAVIGPNGSGKSTLIRALSLLDRLDEGDVSIDGVPFSSCGNGHKSPWPTLTVVFQQLFLWPHLTVRDNILLPLRNVERTNGIVEELVTWFELDALLDRFPNEVSLGERQRAAIVRALALRPRYLLLDEVTSALDVEYLEKVVRRLELLRESGSGVLLVTHLLGLARRVADRVAFMERGRIVEEGTADILKSPGSERLTRFLALLKA